MIKIFKIFFYICLIVVPVVWLSNSPGEVQIVWKGFLVETNVLGLLSVVFFLCISFTTIYMFYTKIKNFPRQVSLRRKEKNINLARNTLADLTIAMSKNDIKSLENNARKIKKQLGENIFSTYLIAISAIRDNDYKKAKKYLDILIKNKKASFVGYKNLAVISVKQNQDKNALKYLKKAHALDKTNSWVSENLSLLLAKGGNWTGASDVLKLADYNSNPELQKKRVYFMIESGHDLVDDPKLSMASIPSVLRLIDFYTKKNDEKRASEIIAKTWKQYQFLEMIKIFLKQDKFNVKIALKRFKMVYNAIRHIDSDETKLALATSALDAKLWGKTKFYLQSISYNNIDKRVSDLWEKLSSSTDKIEVPTLPNPINESPKWTCEICNNKSELWNIKCSDCGAIGSLIWPKSCIYFEKKNKSNFSSFI